MSTHTLLISIVTHNSARVIQRCLDGVFGQSRKDFLVSVFDNASQDGTWEWLQKQARPMALRRSPMNIGFSAAHNLALTEHNCEEFALVLNPDVYLCPNFMENALQGFQVNPRIGSISGKLLRVPESDFISSQWSPGDPHEAAEIIDSTGMYLTSQQRHLDRGADEPDLGQYQKREYVFGASGAAALYRRAMIEDVSINGEFFDDAFFAYREDADLAWRAQGLDWKCLYVPEAVAYHVRKVRPENRRELPAEINCHSVKNRFLMRIKNVAASTYFRFFIPMTLRDLQVIGYVFLREHSSLPGLWYPIRHLRQVLVWRREIKRRRRLPSRDLEYWFHHRAVPITPATGEAPSSHASFKLE
ncbi:MAG: glycosyltransferase family 2 protein [Acidobacteria bacterium]|nr:glycosyltransferase family 2 protein [Acidobacteriota bacterium]MBI3657174.1 glycosyltransferase family 2 protein [Acidobacteriota bacterium]